MGYEEVNFEKINNASKTLGFSISVPTPVRLLEVSAFLHNEIPQVFASDLRGFAVLLVRRVRHAVVLSLT